jgi:hypothetical protein
MINAELLARFLIEPRDMPTVGFNRYAEKPVPDVRIKLDSVLAIDYPREYQDHMVGFKERVLSVLCPAHLECRR